MRYDGRVRPLRDQTLRGQRLRLGNDEVGYLGPALTLQGCTVTFAIAGKNLVLNDVRFLDCTLEVKRKLVHVPFYGALLRDCRVTGTLVGCSFGHWPDYSPQGTERGGVERCDFGAATLDACQFVDCDMSEIVLPAWPHFALRDPERRREALARIDWPGQTRIAMVDALTDLPPKVSALVFHASTLAKQFHATEADLKEALRRLGGVEL